MFKPASQNIVPGQIDRVVAIAGAEKFEALVSSNILTRQRKDIHDILFLAEMETFSLFTLWEAIMATFARRATQFENRHVLFSTDFSGNSDKEIQWNALVLEEQVRKTES